MLVVVLMAAIAIDLGMLRNDRSDNQAAVDSAATAGILAYTEDGGVVACRHALGYLESVLGRAASGIDCLAFPERCLPYTASVEETGTSGAFTVAIVHPVDDGDPLMVPGAIGADPVPLTAADGDRCERLAVSVTEVHETFFGGIIGVDELATRVHAVALDGTDRSPGRMVSVAVLERHGCESLTATGSGSAGIRVGAIDDGNGRSYPGWLAVDSDGAAHCGPKGVVDVSGANAWIRVDGPPGCPGEVGPVGSGQGCGRLEIVAAGTPGCALPACSSGGQLWPSPTQLDRPVTRAPGDHRWNCKAAYPAAYDIEGCFLAGFRPPYVDQLIAAVGPAGIPAGFSSYTSAGFPCTVDNATVVTVPPGNWVVDCALRVGGQLTFIAGNVVFDDDVTVGSNGELRINHANGNVYTWVAETNLIPDQSSSDAAWVYFRAGDLGKNGGGTIDFRSSMVYLAPGSELDVSGGTGAVGWTAPRVGPFADLALWSDSGADIRLGGQASLQMEGVFFAPLSSLSYIGNGSQTQTEGQYFVGELHVVGQGRLDIIPDSRRAVAVPLPHPSILIR